MNRNGYCSGNILVRSFERYLVLCMRILLFLSLGTTFAQKDYRAGYIITLEKDTIQGEVLFRSGKENYNSCTFKNGPQEKVFKPDQILGYGIVEGYYYSSVVLEGSFVEVLVEGKLSLYHSEKRYHVKKDTAVYHLQSDKELIKKDGKEGLIEQSRWQGKLNYLTGDCLGSSEIDLQNLKLRDKSLTRLVVKYNECINSEYKEFNVNKSWVAIEIGLTIGLARSQLRPGFNSSADINSYLDEVYNSIDPTFGVLFEISSPRSAERLAFQLETLYLESSFSSFVNVPGNPIRNFDVYINLSTLSIPMSFKYLFGSKGLRPFVQAGVNIDNHLDSSARLLSEEIRDGIVITNPEEEAFVIKDTQFGYWAGAGLLKSFSKFQAGIGLRAYIMSPLDRTGLFEVNMNRIVLNLMLLTL